jgi:hypothetical protein
MVQVMNSRKRGLVGAVVREESVEKHIMVVVVVVSSV